MAASAAGARERLLEVGGAPGPGTSTAAAAAAADGGAGGAVLAIRGLTASVGGRAVLKGIDARVPAGALCAVMGASGSGKTSLIKAVAGVPSGLLLGGEISMQQVVETGVGYLPQHEELLPALTVRETLDFAARLRRVPGATAAVEALLVYLGLQPCAGTRVGPAGGPGISGGERRRLCLAVRLLRKTALLCADEPTSGLDARSAGLVVDVLRRQAAAGCTVLCSIHQPRAEIFECFTELLLLADGHAVYSGPAAEALDFVERRTGLRPGAGVVNPADFLIDACSLDRTSAEARRRSAERLGVLAAAQRAAAGLHSQELEEALRAGAALLPRRPRRRRCCRGFREVWCLTRRAWVCARRDRVLLLAVLMQNLIFGLIFGLMNWQLTTASLKEIHSRVALLYITPGLTGFFVMSQSLYLLAQDIATFDNEHHRDELYSAPALVLSQLAASLPTNLLAPLPMVVAVYFMANLNTEVAVAPLVFYSVLVLVRLHSTALAMCFTVLLPRRDFGASSVVTNAFFLLCIFTGGFLTPIQSVPRFLRWFRWFAYTFYAFRWNMTAQFSDLTLDLGVPGEVVLAQFSIKAHDFVVPPLAILSLTIAWLLLAMLCLHLVAPQLAAPKAVDADGEQADDGSVLGASAAGFSAGDGPREVQGPGCGTALALEHVCLDVVPAGGLATMPAKRLLDDITVLFPRAQLSAMVGPSGAGKTTLLAVLAGRAAGRTARLTGEVRLGGLAVRAAELARRVAIVGQEDHHLPGLTVQETLHFYSALRLPSEPPAARRQRVQTLVAALGMSGCLTTLVGTQGAGGISGGERRRLSVLMACLGDPAVLLLDEPTTGLDALAAQQLLRLLKRLVLERGQTIVCTVHQARADLLPLLDHLLLLGPGGRALWQGGSRELPLALAACGAGAGAATAGNPLDAAIDVMASEEGARRLRETWALAAPAADVAGLAEGGRERTEVRRCPPVTAFRILLSRSLLNFARQPAMIWARCFQVVIFAVVLVPVYAPLGRSQSSITSRIGLLYQALGMLFAGTLNNLAVFPTERDVVLRESADGLYSPGPFFAAYALVELALEVATSAVAGLTIVQATGLRGELGPQLTFIAVMVASLFNGESIGIMLNSVVMHPGFSVSMINAFCAVLQIIAGFMANSLPGFLQVLNHASPQMYACRALALSQFPKEQTFDCDGPSPLLCLRDGAAVRASLGMDDIGSLALNAGGLAACCVAYRAASFCLLRFRIRRQSRF